MRMRSNGFALLNVCFTTMYPTLALAALMRARGAGGISYVPLGLRTNEKFKNRISNGRDNK